LASVLVELFDFFFEDDRDWCAHMTASRELHFPQSELKRRHGATMPQQLEARRHKKVNMELWCGRTTAIHGGAKRFAQGEGGQ
jgi:hypothetical protein